jgi:hypothetical protein
MDILKRIMLLDRRWVFLLLAVVCILTYMASFQIPIIRSPEVQAIYNFMDSLQPGDVIHMGVDYDPSTLAELHPMTYAIAEQAFRKNVKVIFTALSQNGPGMVDQAIRDIGDSMKIDRTYNGVLYKGREIQNGVDYVFLGYKPYPALVIYGMGQNYRIPYPADYFGTPLDSIPLMKKIKNYDQVKGVIGIIAGNVADMWIVYGQGRYNFKLALGLTGVMGADYYPYLSTGQLFGIMGGLLGAAQYEDMTNNPGPAKEGMRIQVFAHMLMIVFIILANIGFIATKKIRRTEEVK